MARITVVSMAFWGDVMPFVPIANELAGRGHDVTFAVPEGFWPVLGNERFGLAPVGLIPTRDHLPPGWPSSRWCADRRRVTSAGRGAPGNDKIEAVLSR
jgi:hypothetical protein